MNKIKPILLFFCLILLACLACDKKEVADPDKALLDLQGDKGFVGPVFGTNAFVAVLVSNDEAIAYVCHGDEQISEWFKFPIVDMHNFELTNVDASLNASFNGRSFTGEVTLKNNQTLTFSADPIKTENFIVQRAFGQAVEADNVSLGWVFFLKKDSEGEARPDNRGAFVVDGVFQETPSLEAGKTSITIGTGYDAKTYRVKQFGISRLSDSEASIISING